ncbi:MAG: hypothetical protein H7Z40_21170 [Phycisphaerae bacterium]|nr:hypothetical protein [Gemmatimonadaceae bacterium]
MIDTRALILAFALLCQVACGSATEQRARTSGPSIRDSAGVQIVENAAPSDTNARWSIDSAPLVTLGSPSSGRDDVEYQFHTVQGAARMRSGEILVADWGSTTVRVFDSLGVFQRTLVKKGGGPGELFTVSELYHTRGDSVYVYNGEGANMVVFGPDLKLARTVPRVQFLPDSLRKPYSSPGVHGIFDDGTVLGSAKIAHGLDSKTMKIGDGYQNVADSTYWVRARAGDTQLADYGWLVGRRIAGARLSRGSFRGYSNDLPQGLSATRGVALYHVDGQRYEVREFGSDGKLRWVIRMPMTSMPFTKSSWPGFPGDSIKRAPTPAIYPLIDELNIDFSGNIWLASRHPANTPRARIWHVFDSTGALQHRVLDWSGMHVKEIGDDYLLGTARDRDGVESVVQHRLRKR